MAHSVSKRLPIYKSVKNAVILAGGRGERLLPLTLERPKCMVDVLGQPIISYQLSWLRVSGVRNVVIACGYMHDVVMDYVGDGSRWNLKVSYEVEEQPRGRGGALKAALKQMAPLSGPVLAINGDHISNVPVDELVRFHQTYRPTATIVTTRLRSPYGIVETGKGGVVTGFREKPELPYGVNAGIYILNPEILAKLPDIGDHEAQAFPELAERGKLRAFQTDAFWRTIDTMKDLNELRKDFEGLSLETFFGERLLVKGR